MTVLLVAVVAACTNRPPAELVEPTTTTTTTTEPEALDVERVARESTFRVINRTCLTAGSGSAVLLDPTTIVTNRHVVEGAVELDVETWDGRVHHINVASQSTRADLAVLRLSRPLPYEPVTFSATPPESDDHLTVLGYPLNGPYKATRATVIGFDTGEGLGHPDDQILRLKVRLRPGNSGGPLLNSHGELVGVVYAEDIRNGDGLAVPANLIQDLIAGQHSEPVRDCLDYTLGG